MTCNFERHACIPAAVDGAPDGGPTADATSDRPADSPSDLASDDSPRDGAGGDSAADATPAEVHTGCNVNDDCTADPSKPVCQYATGLCVGCLENTDCTTAQTPVCDRAATTCVQCLLSSQCTDPTTPICDAKICRGCKTDSECTGIGPEVCMSHLDGRCATDDETIYVLNTMNACSDTGSGSKTLPVCKPQVAIDLATSNSPATTDAGSSDDAGAGRDVDGGARKVIKDLVVMRGPSLTPWSFTVPNRTISVIGKEGATLTAGGYIGIRIDAGTVYLRDLRITGSTFGPGVVAGGGEVHIDRCVVDANKGGIQIDKAGFEITNTVIANNSPAMFGIATWGGAILGEVPPGKPARFVNNTVVSNLAPGMFCTENNPHDVSSSIFANNTLGDGGGCTVAVCCTGDPALGSDYRFTSAASPCKDKLTPAMSTAFDIDGQPRPSGAMSDCGADEYVAPMP